MGYIAYQLYLGVDSQAYHHQGMYTNTWSVFSYFRNNRYTKILIYLSILDSLWIMLYILFLFFSKCCCNSLQSLTDYRS